jgi:hypothetical protein
MNQEIASRPALQTRPLPRPNYEPAGAADWRDIETEPTLDEILADPIVHLVLGRDHLEIRDVERFLRAASRRLAGGPQPATAGHSKQFAAAPYF